MRFETLCLHAGHEPDPTTLSCAVPVYRTSSYVFKDTEHAANLFALKESGNIYSRLMNPTQDVLEKRIAALEGGAAALALSSGTSAIFYTVINLCQTGDEIVSANNLYGGTFTQFNDILKQFGIKTHFVNPADPENFAKAITPKTKLLYCETVGNPGLDVSDIEKIANIAHAHGLPLVVDSTFTTPYLQRPMEFGADIVLHSLTKWMGGHGVALGGIVVDSGKFNWRSEKFPMLNNPDASYHDIRWTHDLGDLNPLAFIIRMRLVPLRNLGACISPDNAWFFLQGLETLPLRMERHCQNALAIAQFLKNHPKVAWIRFPALPEDTSFDLSKKYLQGKGCGMIVFGIQGGKKSGANFIDNLKVFSHLANVGDAKSLAIHPASTTHSQLNEEQQLSVGIKPEMIRLSIGLEHVEDLVEDLTRALETSKI